MTIIRFETCDRQRALLFLQKFYPKHQITDTPESAGPMLDMVAQDIFRIPDPEMHPNGAVVPSQNWKPEHMKQAQAALNVLHASPKKEDAA